MLALLLLTASVVAQTPNVPVSATVVINGIGPNTCRLLPADVNGTYTSYARNPDRLIASFNGLVSDTRLASTSDPILGRHSTRAFVRTEERTNGQVLVTVWIAFQVGPNLASTKPYYIALINGPLTNGTSVTMTCGGNLAGNDELMGLPGSTCRLTIDKVLPQTTP